MVLSKQLRVPLDLERGVLPFSANAMSSAWSTSQAPKRSSKASTVVPSSEMGGCCDPVLSFRRFCCSRGVLVAFPDPDKRRATPARGLPRVRGLAAPPLRGLAAPPVRGVPAPPVQGVPTPLRGLEAKPVRGLQGLQTPPSELRARGLHWVKDTRLDTACSGRSFFTALRPHAWVAPRRCKSRTVSLRGGAEPLRLMAPG
mmetsp:Transcript_43100/g.116212  ORF Transcript_43100/g.116212 Transcript_43100/m.116212 type:complete len:200 (+) Transcript_43100:766-1365(+)